MLPTPVPKPTWVDSTALREFQERNNLGVYVYDWHTHSVSDEGGDVEISAPRFLFKPDKIYDDEVTLLFFEGFFTLIKNTVQNGRNAFFTTQRDENVREVKTGMRACHRCMDFFTHKVSKDREKSVWQKHMDCKDCSIQDAEPADYRLPKGKEAFIFFKEHGLQHNRPCVVYADLETSNEQFDDGKQLRRANEEEGDQTKGRIAF